MICIWFSIQYKNVKFVSWNFKLSCKFWRNISYQVYSISTYFFIRTRIYTNAVAQWREVCDCAHIYTKPNTCVAKWWLICERPASIDRADQWHRLPRVSLFSHPTPSSCNVHVRDPLELSDWHIRFRLSNACCRKQCNWETLNMVYHLTVIHAAKWNDKWSLNLNNHFFLYQSTKIFPSR